MYSRKIPELQPGKLYLIASIGIPFSGKSEYFNALHKILHAEYLSFDEELSSKYSKSEVEKLTYQNALHIVHGALIEIVQKSKNPVVLFDAMNITFEERERIRTIAKSHDRIPVFIFFPITPEQAVLQMKKSKRERIPRGNIFEAYSILKIRQTETDIKYISETHKAI